MVAAEGRAIETPTGEAAAAARVAEGVRVGEKSYPFSCFSAIMRSRRRTPQPDDQL